MFLQQRNKAAANAGKSAEAKEQEERLARMRPWVEKYRPKTIEEVAAQDHTVNVLRKALLSTNLPHMLFYGPPGTGKTSTILALARQLFGPELMKSRVLELNASDERGISVVRDKIKNFAKLAVSNAHVDFPCPPYKIIILDEADSMTQDAQSALRRIMEQYSRITRFCLVCNYVTRIIEPLASRCSKFRFRMLDNTSTQDRLESIARAEGVDFEQGVLDTLIKTSDGDLRRAITYLQSASRLHSVGDKATPITPVSIIDIAGVVPERAVRGLARAIGVPARLDQGDDDEVDLAPMPTTGSKTGGGAARGFDQLRAQVTHVTREGYSTSQLLLQVSRRGMRAKADAVVSFGLTDRPSLQQRRPRPPAARLYHGARDVDRSAQGQVCPRSRPSGQGSDRRRRRGAAAPQSVSQDEALAGVADLGSNSGSGSGSGSRLKGAQKGRHGMPQWQERGLPPPSDVTMYFRRHPLRLEKPPYTISESVRAAVCAQWGTRRGGQDTSKRRCWHSNLSTCDGKRHAPPLLILNYIGRDEWARREGKQ